MLFLQIFPLKFFPTHQTPPPLFSGLASDKGGTDKIAIFQAGGLAIKFASVRFSSIRHNLVYSTGRQLYPQHQWTAAPSEHFSGAARFTRLPEKAKRWFS